MWKIIGRTLAILIVAATIVTATNYAVSSGTISNRFGSEHEENEHRERNINPNSLTNQYPVLGVAAGLMPTVFKIVGLGIVTVQVGNMLNRRRRAQRRPA